MRSVYAYLVVGAFVRVAAADPQADAVIKQAAALELARSNRLTEALVAIDHAVELAPDKPEPVFLRAGIRFMLAGDASTLEHLGEERPGVDYAVMVVNLEGAIADLRRYLELSPVAADRIAVLESIGKLEARVVAARSMRDAIANREAAERRRRDLAALWSRVPRTLSLADLSQVTHVGVEQTIGVVSPVDGAAELTRIHLDFAVLPWLKIYGTAAVGFVQSPTAGGSALGNLIGAVRLVKPLNKIRVAATAQYSVDTSSSGPTTEALGMLEGARLPSGFVHAGAFRFAAAIRFSHGRLFLQGDAAIERLFDGPAHIGWLVPLGVGGGLRVRPSLSVLADVITTLGSVVDTEMGGVKPVLGDLGQAYAIDLGVQHERGPHIIRVRGYFADGGLLDGVAPAIGIDYYRQVAW